MNNLSSTVNDQEVTKFAQHANDWWDSEGPLKTLHDINAIRLEFVSRFINWQDCRVLDVGCGGGILSEGMARGGAQVVAIDAALPAIEIAQAHAQMNHLAIEYYCSPIEEFESKSFDVITCMEMLEHVQNPVLVLEHCKRLLKPGGFVFLSTINRTLKAYATAIIAAEYLLNILPRQTHDYSKFIKPSELIAMARSIDLNLVEMAGLHYNPFLRTTSLSPDISVNYLLALQ